jgi:hypothetical protein
MTDASMVVEHDPAAGRNAGAGSLGNWVLVPGSLGKPPVMTRRVSLGFALF